MKYQVKVKWKFILNVTCGTLNGHLKTRQAPWVTTDGLFGPWEWSTCQANVLKALWVGKSNARTREVRVHIGKDWVRSRSILAFFSLSLSLSLFRFSSVRTVKYAQVNASLSLPSCVYGFELTFYSHPKREAEVVVYLQNLSESNHL